VVKQSETIDVPDKPLSKIFVSVSFLSFLETCFSSINQDVSKHPLSLESHGLVQYSKTQKSPFQNQNLHQLEAKPDRKFRE